MNRADKFPLLNRISSGILAIDAKADIVLWNSQLEQWTGQDHRNLVGNNLFDQFPEFANAKNRSAIEQVLGGDKQSVLFRPRKHHPLIPCPMPDGDMRQLHITVSWLQEQQIALFTIQDQTQQLKLVEKHKQTSHELQKQLKQRQMLEEEKFRHTQKQEALITLVGGIAHDFNNLLAGLVGQVYLASREVAELPKTAARMKKVQDIAQEASEIVKQLLTFARQGEYHAREFPLTSFIKEFAKLAAHSVPENIKLVADFDRGPFPFRGDANQLQQSLLNIVHNAVDACQDQHDGKIEINLYDFNPADHIDLLKKFPVLRHGNFAHIQIRDNGQGMSEEVVEKIFDPFFTTKQLGSGLGLAMVLGCIRNHHGMIDVESCPGEGSCFHIFLPVISATKAQITTTSDDHTSARILLVDDDTRVLEPTKELLESMGHHVELAENGEDAVDLFSQKQDEWDIVITDIVMPRMNGVEASKQMRQLRPEIPIVFATGYDPSLVTNGVQKMENSKLISKPFNPDVLDRLISEMVKKSAN